MSPTDDDRGVAPRQGDSEYAGAIHELGLILAERDRRISRLGERLAERDRQIDALSDALAERERQIGALAEHTAAQIDALRRSTSWRITAPLRALVGLLGKRPEYRIALRMSYRGLRHSLWGRDRQITGAATLAEAQEPPVSGAVADAPVPFWSNDYEEWVGRYDRLDDAGRRRIRRRIGGFARRPGVSLLMSVGNPPLVWLDEAICSVRNQLYPNWELCIGGRTTWNRAVQELIARHAECDSRIRLAGGAMGGDGFSALESALRLAVGDYCAVLGDEDLLAEHALFFAVLTALEHPGAGLIYSDEDEIASLGHRLSPHFKCELNEELLLAYDMISRLALYRRDLLQAIGGFRPEFEGQQEYDMALRATERLAPEQVVHIPRVLYHRRAEGGADMRGAGAEDRMAELGRRAVAERLERSGIAADVEPAPAFPRYNRVRFGPRDPLPLVSIVIPTRDRVDLLATCIDSIVERSTFQHWEILIVDNGSVEAETEAYLLALPTDRARVLRDDGPFNFSRLINLGVREAKGEVLCLLNNDMEVLSPDWIEEMLSHACRPEVGSVGARLWYPDGRLQHGGVITGLYDVAGHSHKYLAAGAPGYFGRAQVHQSFSAVTGAALMVRRSVFDRMGGFDEGLAVAYNDVDFCLRVRAAGFRNVWTPYAEMIHHESVSRGADDHPEKQARLQEEILQMQASWGESLMADPAYNPNLTLKHEDFSLAWPPRVEPY